MTKANSILHRAVALLAALCLLASMALPVYAAETETEFSVSNSETIPDDDNTGNGADGTGSDISVSNLETIQKDADTTNEGSKTEPEISVPESGTIPNSADTTDKAADAPLAEGVTGSENTAPADNATADKTADADNTGEDSTGSEDEAGFLNEGDSADDRMITAGNAKESDIALCADNATVQEGTKYTFYFAPPKIWKDKLLETPTITCSFRRGNGNESEPKNSVKETPAKRTGDLTKDGCPIYQVDVYNKDDGNSLCPYGGFVWVKFRLDDAHWVQMNGESQGNNAYWMPVTAIADQCLDGNKLTENQKNDYDLSKWVKPADITLKHVRYCGQTMTLLNNSDKALDNVTVTFWEKGDDGKFTPVGDSRTINALQAGEHADITIPETACTYVRFQKADGTCIGKQYFNFYNDEPETENIAVFPYDPVTRYCLIYKGDNDVRWSAPNSKTVYFDATFSNMLYNGEGTAVQHGMPGANGSLWCYMTSDENGKPAITSQMAHDGNSEIWYVDVPEGYTKIRFASWEVVNDAVAANGDGTKMWEIPPKLSKPCFYADTSDDVIYQGGNRGGYWGEKGAIRDAESGKNTTVVNIASEKFTQEAGTKYITSTLYDYYTDYELNGLNRDSYPDSSTNSQRWYVTFEQFDRALSSAYAANGNVQYPIYTGHFQPSINNWSCPFADVAAGMGLYGWNSNTDTDEYKKFMAVNNSVLDTMGKPADDEAGYARTFQGLVEDKTSTGDANGLPVLKGKAGTGSLVDPHFDKEFLEGKNTFNTVLGKVYENVSFPFTQDAVFKSTGNANDKEAKAEYWYYDSSKSSLYLTQGNGKFYLESTKDESGKLTTDRKSANRNAKNEEKKTNDVVTCGFFPFNKSVGNGGASQYNYGFGAKLQFDFTLTDDGNVVVGTDENGKDIKVPIKFFFSGDDDVWVYIDGQLVLDVGGAHGKASGLLEFGDNGTDNTVTPYVSSNKAGGAVYEDYKVGDNVKSVYFNGKQVTFDKKGNILNKDSSPFTLTKGTTHTLTMFYMERGMWESNMAVAFNFPDHNELQVEKKVDVTGVNKLFQDSFQNQKIFTFNIKNLATHYKAKETSYKEGEIKALPEAAYTGAQKPSDTSASLTYASEPPPESKAGDLAVLWSATRDDPTSAHREKRRGTLPLSTAIDISQYSYLTFDVYVEGKQTDTCALGNLYVELWDNQGHQKGCINGKGLQSSDVYGAATALHPGQWYTIRLLLNSLKTTDKGFNNMLQSIKVGDNFARSIYLRNFTFRSAPKEQIKPGFTTEQYDIPDYGSATSGKLENATYAVFSSDRGNGDVVDENGQFLLQDGETVTFKDQFRRGSYIALKEQVDPNLYDTFWTVYENDAPVTKVSGASEYVTTDTNIKSLENVESTAPDDGRTEKVIDEEKDKNGNPIKNAYVSTDKKPKDNTLVFRSYSDKTDKDELTKLKVVFTNKVKTGKLIIRKEAAKDETLLGQTFTFTVKFSDVGGQGLGVDIPEQNYYCTVTEQANGQEYGEVEIKGIPVGTRFVVSEVAQEGTNLQSVTITGGKDCAITEDGKRVRGSVVEGDANVATAKFVNTKRQLTDLVVTKQWVKQDGTVIKDGLPTAIYLKLQRTKTPGDEGSWEDVQKVKQLTDSYSGWVTTFTGLDKFDASDTGETHEYYTYRVLESVTGTGNNWHGGAADDVIEIDGKKYTILKNTVQVEESSATPLKLTLTNQLQDAKYNLNITKQDAEDKTKLGGVEFKLEKLGVDGKPDTAFTAVAKTKSSEDADKGKCSFENLKPGSYRLTETKTAEGYTLLADAIEFELTTGGQCVHNAAPFGDVQYDSTTGVYNIALTINNRKSFELPHTGADAPSLWLLIGLPALVTVLLVLVFRYNKKGGRRQ